MRVEELPAGEGPRVPRWDRLAIEYLAEREEVPMRHIWQEALECLLATKQWTLTELRDYYGKRAEGLDKHMGEAQTRGATRLKAKRHAA